MKRPVDFAAALAEARRVLEKPQQVPMTWYTGFVTLRDARDALGRALAPIRSRRPSGDCGA